MLKINLTVLFLAFIIMGCNGQPNQNSRLTERNLPKFSKSGKKIRIVWQLKNIQRIRLLQRF